MTSLHVLSNINHLVCVLLTSTCPWFYLCNQPNLQAAHWIMYQLPLYLTLTWVFPSRLLLTKLKTSSNPFIGLEITPISQRDILVCLTNFIYQTRWVSSNYIKFIDVWKVSLLRTTSAGQQECQNVCLTEIFVIISQNKFWEKVAHKNYKWIFFWRKTWLTLNKSYEKPLICANLFPM